MRQVLLTVPMLVILAMAGPARAGANEPTTEPRASNGFVVPMTTTTTSENVIEQVMAAGHDQLVAACEANPAASIHVFTPLVSGDDADILCSSILSGREPVGQSSEALMSGGERIGQVQQKWSPVGLACSAITFGSALVMTYAMCPRATTPEHERNCGYLGNVGMGGLSFLCFLI